MHAERHSVTLTTTAGGAATEYTPVVTGRVLQVQYVPDGTAPYDNTVDFTITGEATGQAILTKANVAAAFTNLPRVKTQDEAGADALYAAGGLSVREAPVVAQERIKIVLAQGGATKTGVVIVTIG